MEETSEVSQQLGEAKDKRNLRESYQKHKSSFLATNVHLNASMLV
jgi:hypothetical protein